MKLTGKGSAIFKMGGVSVKAQCHMMISNKEQLTFILAYIIHKENLGLSIDILLDTVRHVIHRHLQVQDEEDFVQLVRENLLLKWDHNNDRVGNRFS